MFKSIVSHFDDKVSKIFRKFSSKDYTMTSTGTWPINRSSTTGTVMNLYDLHDDPKSLHGYDKAGMEVPVVFWDKYQNKPEEMKKREKYLAKSAKYAYRYADYILHGPFPAGEAAIAKWKL